MKKLYQRSPQWVARLVCFRVHKVADSGLATADLLSDLRLRHLAVTLDFGDYVFPVHAQTITAIRYLCNDFQIHLGCSI